MHAQDLTEDEEAEAVDEDVVDDVTTEDEDDEAEVEDDENAELVSGRMGLNTFNKCSRGVSLDFLILGASVHHVTFSH